MCENRPGFCALLFTLAIVWVQPADAQPFPAGAEFQVNTYTTNSQTRPSVATGTAGDFIAVWSGAGWSGSDPGPAVQGQRYDSLGTPLGGEFQINTYTTGEQVDATVAIDSSGSFLVAWWGDGAVDPSAIQGQRFDPSGAPAGTEFQINSYTTGNQLRPRIAAVPSGGWIVVWESVGSSGSDTDGFSVQAQRFDSSGASVGTEFQVNTYTTGYQRRADVAIDGSGSFVIVWESDGSGQSDTDDYSVQGQRFDSSGAPVGVEFQVNSYTTGYQRKAGVASDASGNFTVVWESQDSSGPDFSATSIQGQRFDSACAPLGTQFQVNTYARAFQEEPAIAADGSGNVVVVWESGLATSSDPGNSIQGQRFDGAGTPLGSQFQINTYTTDAQRVPSIAADATGGFVVVWTSEYSSEPDSSGDSIQGQRFSTAALCGPSPEPDGSCRLAAPQGTGGSSVLVQNVDKNQKDRIVWTWKRGVATDVADFKTPTGPGATYRLCIYDGSASPQPLLESEIPNGGVVPTCGPAATPCWKTTGSRGFRYRQKFASLHDIQSVKLKAGADGKARVQVKAKGADLAPPATDGLVPDVVVQLLIDDGLTTECFKTSFPGAGGVVKRQDDKVFKARGP